VPRQVPDPDVAVSRPEPVARFIPLDRVTLMVPASATWPDADIMALDDATRPLLMPMESVAPLPHVEFDELIRTFHSPSNVAAAAGVAADNPASNSMLLAISALRRCLMTFPFVPARPMSQIGSQGTVMAITPVVLGAILTLTRDI